MAWRILSGPSARAVQPPCQREIPGFIEFFERRAGIAEKLAGPLARHPAI
jgi:hypothetical protein